MWGSRVEFGAPDKHSPFTFMTLHNLFHGTSEKLNEAGAKYLSKERRMIEYETQDAYSRLFSN